MKHDININDGDLQFMKAEVAAWRTMLEGFRATLEKIAALKWNASLKIMGVKIFEAKASSE